MGEGAALGSAISVASGIRLLYWTIGPRFRFGHFDNWNLWTLNLDVGWRVPLGRLEPYGFVGAGFAKVDTTSPPIQRPDGTDYRVTATTTGFDVRLGGGVDYYVSNTFSVGGVLSADWVRLAPFSTTNSRLGASARPESANVGVSFMACAMLGLHF